MMLTNLHKYKIILASNSPRRKELLAGLDVPFEVRTISGIDESYPATLRSTEIPLYIAKAKAEAYRPTMAADELIDYLENGNITNSVNMPNISMARSGNARICVIHKNIPNTLNSITAVTSASNVNIENMLNKSKNAYAYTMLDINTDNSEEIANAIAAVEGVIKVRII